MIAMTTLVRLLFEKNASDLHLTAGAPPVLRVDGELVPTELDVLKPELCFSIIANVLTDEQRQLFEKDNELDVSFGFEKIGRVRMNVFKQRGTVAATLRRIPNDLPGFEELGLPPLLNDIVQLPKGLVVVTGPARSGKSTTLAVMLDWINRNKSVHVLTVEHPIEYIFTNDKAILNQREAGTDTQNMTRALRQALRADPDVVMIGDLESPDTIAAALDLAETGRLVLASVQGTDSVQAIYRLLDGFQPHQQFRARLQLSQVLQAVLAQQLLPRGYSSGSALACELLIPTSAVRGLIRDEKEHQIYPLMQAGAEYGMQTMNQALFELYQKQLVTYNEIFSRTTDPRDLQQLIKGTT